VTPAVHDALVAVLDRFDSFNRLGALRREGGERAFRGWLASGLLGPALGWPWTNVVFGESMDVLMLDWRDLPVIYIETKTPTQPIRIDHRREMDGRLDRWGSLAVAVLTNGREWERFDKPAKPLGEPSAALAPPWPHEATAAFFRPLQAVDFLPAAI
jgi:hypothetical protein